MNRTASQDRHPRTLIANFIMYAAAFFLTGSFFATPAVMIASLTFIAFVLLAFAGSTATLAAVNRRR